MSERFEVVRAVVSPPLRRFGFLFVKITVEVSFALLGASIIAYPFDYFGVFPNFLPNIGVPVTTGQGLLLGIFLVWGRCWSIPEAWTQSEEEQS